MPAHFTARVRQAHSLSGGLDSGSICSGHMAKARTNHSARSRWALRMSRMKSLWHDWSPKNSKTSQHESYPRDDVVSMLPAMIWHLDEPSDMVVVSKYLISRTAAPHVDSVMSGDGGDELFAGFMRYLGLRDAQHYSRVPAWLRNGIIGPLARVHLRGQGRPEGLAGRSCG